MQTSLVTPLSSTNLYVFNVNRNVGRATTKGVVVKPILSKDYGSRVQIDLIDMQSMCKGSYRWIMVYQDHLTKYCVLRPLTSKRAAEVAWQLVDIFLLLGAPQILQSDNGSEFTASVITELKVMWPDLLMVHGKPRHPASQGSVERLNSDVKDMLIRAGILKGSYSRNQFDLCPHPLYSVNDFSTDKEIGLRQAVQQGSKCGGQGFSKCNCGKQCKYNKCKCFKAGLKCNSKCHASMTCPNKI